MSSGSAPKVIPPYLVFPILFEAVLLPAAAPDPGADLPHNGTMEESRITSRGRIFKAGTIEFGGGGIDCTVRNLSKTGAALEVLTPLFIPDRFTLFMPSDQFKRSCHIVWRKDKLIGVAFD
jgi:hypothetical protein